MTSSSAGTSPKPGRGRAALIHAAVLGFYTLLSLVMTYPLALHLTDSVAGQIGDNIYFVFLIKWYQQAWFGLHISPFFSPLLNYPQGWNLASTDTSLATTLPGLFFSLFGGATFGYNAAMLLTFVLSGWAMFYWVRRLTGSTGAGLVGGMIYAFLPYRMAHFLIGHLNLSGTEWFPLYFMGLYDLLRKKEGWQWSSILLTAVTLGLIGLTSMYYLYMTLLISVVFVFAYWLLVDRALLRSRWFYQRMAGVGVASIPLLAAGILPFLGLNSQGGLASRSVSYASMYSASPTDFFLPSTLQFLVGKWVGQHFDRSLWVEATLYIGIVALVLAGVAWLRRKESEHRPLMKVALVVIGVAFILALGVRLHWLGQEVTMPMPAAVQTYLHSNAVPMPALILFRFLPFFDKMRAIMRMGFFVLIFTTLLAGLGAAWLLQWVGKRRAPWVTALLLILVFVDFYPGAFPQFAQVTGRPVDEWLAAQPGQGAVAQFPFGQEDDQQQVYNTLIHGKPFIGGFFSANQPEQYGRIKPVLEAFPSAEGKAILGQLGVHWVLFDLSAYPDFAAVRAQVERLGLKYDTTVSGQAVFELPAP